MKPKVVRIGAQELLARVLVWASVTTVCGLLVVAPKPTGLTGIVRNANLFGPDYVGLELVGIGAGNCLMIAPLSVGTHTIYATGTFPGLGSYEVQDTIIVTPAGK